MFTHLHTHSCYSFLEGLPTPAQLAQAAADNGMTALALVDRDNLSGAIEFYDACREVGVQPILGLELDMAAAPAADEVTSGPITLLAMDLDGWANLCRLSSVRQTRPEFLESGSLPFDLLAGHSSGLICLSGGARSLAAGWLRAGQPAWVRRHLQQLQELFPGRLYVELQRHAPDDNGLTHRLADLAAALDLPVVATHTVHYLDSGQAQLQRTLSAMRLNCLRSDLPAEASAPSEACFLSMAQMEARFADLPAAVAVSLDVAARCRLELPLGVPHYPAIPLPQGTSAIQALREKAYQGARALYGDLQPGIRERLEHELAVIEESGYAALFLIMEGVIAFARQADIPYASRGSAASSLVAHCLGITTPDPLRHNLYFERFLNPARRQPPDIDTDLCSRRRDEVIQHVYETYGAERVAMVATVNRFRARSALREVAKAYGLPASEISAMVEALPWRWWGPPGKRPGWSPYAALAERFRTERQRRILQDASALLGLPRHLSVHPGGVVISPTPLTDMVPTLLASKGVVTTQFDLGSIARLGLVKIDLLGIRGLTVLGDVAEAVRKQRPRPYPPRLEVLDGIPTEDPVTAELLQAGRTIGCFQIESPGMRATLREIQAHNQDDLLAALALYRPGPLTGGLKDAFVRRHLGQEPVTHLHPALEPLLADTYGVILYQEQVLRIAHELAGLSLAESDLLRRAMSHFDPGKQMQTLRSRFIVGARARHGVPAEVAARVWDLMAAFAGYGFPKAHAASYAEIAWRSAWCKAHHPAEFMAAVLASWGGYYPQRVYLTEARNLGLTVRPPHINHSRREFTLRYLEGEPVLFMGLDQVRDLTRRSQRRIMRARPFHSLADFLTRVDPRPGEAENLVRVGALEGMGTIPGLLQSLKAASWERGQLPLFGMEPESDMRWSLAERVRAQEQLLGVSVDVHPLELVRDRLQTEHVVSSLDAAASPGRRVRVVGVRVSGRWVADGQGHRSYLLMLEDLEGVIEVVIDDAVYRRHRLVLHDSGPLVVEGLVEGEEAANEVRVRAERLWLIERGGRI